MKLVHPDIKNQIIFSENKVNVLTIENKTFFTEFVSELFSQYSGNEGKFILSEDDKELSIPKTCELILNPINLDINNKQKGQVLDKKSNMRKDVKKHRRAGISNDKIILHY